MALKADILKERLKEAFGMDSQETVAGKLNMTQGNVSKLLSGTQQPALETVYHVAEAYKVSVDWLLGLSEKKDVMDGLTYASSIEMLLGLEKHGAITIVENPGKRLSIDMRDPIIYALIKKSHALSRMDAELHQNWVETKFSLFREKPLLYSVAWESDRVNFYVSEAVSESNWLEVYEIAKKAEDDYSVAMGEDTSPFNE